MKTIYDTFREVTPLISSCRITIAPSTHKSKVEISKITSF